MIDLDAALLLVRARCHALPAETVPLPEAAGRILAKAVVARRDQPGADISMMDGYAVRAADSGSSLQIIGELAAGDAPWSRALAAGEAARIFTGAPLPSGADCVVMQERCVRDGARLTLEEVPREGQHVRRRGEELRQGVEALPAGARLGPAELSLAAACGVPAVSVHRRPRIALLATGDELVPLGSEPGPGKLIETNSLSLSALSREAGADPVLLGIESDNAARIAARLRLADADVLLTTGGASVGDHDHAQAALELLGGTLVFHRVAIRPGKPVLFGSSDDRLLFGLPGNPAAASLCFELFVRLALRMLAGDPRPGRPSARAVLRGSIARVPGQTFFPRGRATLSGTTLTFAPGGQQSSMQIASWSAVNAVAVIPPGDGRIESGEEIDLLLTGPLQ